MSLHNLNSPKRNRRTRSLCNWLLVFWMLGVFYFAYSNTYLLSPDQSSQYHHAVATKEASKPGAKSSAKHAVLLFRRLINARYPKLFSAKKGILKDPVVRTLVYLDMLRNSTSSSNENIYNANMNYMLSNYDYDDRCTLYFNLLYASELTKENNNKNGQVVEPIVNAHREFHYNSRHNGGFQKFKEDEINEIKELKKKALEEAGEEVDESKLELSEEELSQLEPKYQEILKLISEEEQILHDYMAHLKIFNRCFLKDAGVLKQNDAFISSQKSKLKGLQFINQKPGSRITKKEKAIFSTTRHLENKLYPWLSQKSPIYENGGKKTALISSMYPFASTPFLKQFRDKLSGKGIVLTIADHHLESTIRLIHLLRALLNDLPIQIIYTPESLSEESKHQILQASVSAFNTFPVQDVTFVNVEPAIAENYRGKFGGFGNKILAVLFNTFEEMMLIDADTVIMIPPSEFFELRKYKRSGTLFYKDRSTIEFRPESDLVFFKKLMNTQVDEVMFGLAQPSNSTMQLPFFAYRLNHLMESGLVLVDRRRYFEQPLIMAQLNFYNTVQSRVYGDKELFWLALVILGQNEFQFNELFAGAIGEVTPKAERFKDIGKEVKLRSKEICSNHPAHFNDEDYHTLLWFNSGFEFCNQVFQVDFEYESGDKKRYSKFKTTKEYETFMRDKLKIKAAIIPPAPTVHADNDLGEPNRGWFNMRQYCFGYTWCAYSSVGEGDTEESQGLYIEFNLNEIKHFEWLGNTWMSRFDYRSRGQIRKEEKENSDNKEPLKNRVKAQLLEQAKVNQKSNIQIENSGFWSLLFPF